jgi:hypothetical protein
LTVDVHLLLPDEVKQVEWTFENLEFDFVFGHAAGKRFPECVNPTAALAD